MRAALPVLLLVALAGFQSAFCASLEVAEREDASDERVQISDLQNSDESESEEKSEEEEMPHVNCFGQPVRVQIEQMFNPTISSVSKEITQDALTPNPEDKKPEDEGTEARAEVQAQTLNISEEDSAEAEERFDIEVLRHAASDSSAAAAAANVGQKSRPELSQSRSDTTPLAVIYISCIVLVYFRN